MRASRYAALSAASGDAIGTINFLKGVNWSALFWECNHFMDSPRFQHPQQSPLVWPCKAYGKLTPVLGRLNTHILGTQKENYKTLKSIHHCLILMNENLEIPRYSEKLESSGKAVEVRSWVAALSRMFDPLRHSVLNVKDVVTSNRYWQIFMLVNDTSDKKLLDLLAVSDRPLPHSVIDKAIMKDLHLESLGGLL